MSQNRMCGTKNENMVLPNRICDIKNKHKNGITLVFGEGCGIRLYRFLIIVLSSTLLSMGITKTKF